MTTRRGRFIFLLWVFLIAGPTNLRAADDAGKTFVFWTDFWARKVMRSDLDGSNVKALLRTGRAPDGIAIDSGNQKVYWTNMGSIFGFGGGTIQRANLDGSDIETIIPRNITRTPKQLQLDTVNQKIYWCDREGAKLWRSGMDGSQVEILISGHDFGQLVGVALDRQSRKVYFSDRKKSQIMRIGMDIPNGETPENRSDLEVLITMDKRFRPIDLALDLSERMIYFTERGRGTVQRAFMDVPNGQSPSSRTDVELLVTGLDDPIGIALDFRQGKIHFSELGGSIWEAKMDGSDASIIADSMSATGIALE